MCVECEENATETIVIIIKIRIRIMKDDSTCDYNNYRKVGGFVGASTFFVSGHFGDDLRDS